MTIVGIHQPNYLPYLGFFDKMIKSDIFIIYDDAQFNKSDFQHRNRIRIYHGSKWLTVPVEKKHIPINEITVKNDVKMGGLKWGDDHLKQIADNYKNSPYYNKYKDSLRKIYDHEYGLLVDLNMELIKFLMESFNINTKIVYSSEFGLTSKSTEKLVDLMNCVEGDVYLSGPAGKDYLDIQLFEDDSIDIVYQDFEHPVYQQQYDGFVSNLSALDMLLNMGRFPV